MSVQAGENGLRVESVRVVTATDCTVAGLGDSSAMDVPHGYDPTLILVLNLAGTFVFGISGGLAAVRAKLDLFGVVVFAGGRRAGRRHHP